MITIPFRQVFDGVVELWGRNTRKEISPDMTRSLVSKINSRVRTIWSVWQWPEWEITEERAFRQVWHLNAQYLRASVKDGQPDEVFYIPNTTYYRVLSSAAGDPPVGTTPTDTTFFEVIENVDSFVAYDQTCKRAIGIVRGTYARNPRVSLGSNHCSLRYHPSERGVDVLNPSGPTVFLTYSMPVPKYTMTPYVAGKTYHKGDSAFDPTTDECFQALASTTALPADTNFWRRIPFPEKWEDYVVGGAFADSLMEFDQGGLADLQGKQILNAKWDATAEQSIQQEIDSLTVQGQKLTWNFCMNRDQFWCESQPWSGGTVSTLTDVCEDELGWIYPTPTSVPQVAWQYYNQVVALRASVGIPSLDQIATRTLMTGSLAQIVILESGSRTFMQWELVVGAADSADPNGQVQPLDYDAINNNKHWSRLQ